MTSTSRNLANLLGTSTQIPSSKLGDDISTIEQLSSVNDLTSVGNTIGDQRVIGNNLYIWNGTVWFRIALINETPAWDSGGQPSASYNLDGTVPQDATIITLAATDPDGFPITYSYVTGGSMDSIATISQDSSVFTITPKTVGQAPSGGTGTVTFRASDGQNILPYTSNFSLNFGYNIEILLVGGGGSGGKNDTYDYCAGGGGGGGVILSGTYFFAGGQLDIVVGAGGVAPVANRGNGTTGGVSSIQVNGAGSTYIALARGGGGGARGSGTAGDEVGGDGANGGGGYAAGGVDDPGMGYGVNGTEIAGYHGYGTIGSYGGGGGGGAGQNGQSSGDGGNGTNAYSTWATATSTGDNGYYGGGGAGVRYQEVHGGGLSGGNGGGADGNFISGQSDRWQGEDGTANTGGGGGGGGGRFGGQVATAAGDGGSGIVIVRYTGAAKNSNGNSVVTTGGYTYHVYTSSGTYS